MGLGRLAPQLRHVRFVVQRRLALEPSHRCLERYHLRTVGRPVDRQTLKNATQIMYLH
jgi:hypothetical protein